MLKIYGLTRSVSLAYPEFAVSHAVPEGSLAALSGPIK
jgi:hypothetical protein